MEFVVIARYTGEDAFAERTRFDLVPLGGWAGGWTWAGCTLMKIPLVEYLSLGA